MTSYVEELDELESLIEAFAKTGKLIVLDFWAKWCGPCVQIGPYFEQLAKEHHEIIFCKINAEEAVEICEKFEIHMLPTFLFFKNGVKIGSLTGGDTEALKNAIIEYSD